MSPVGVFSNLLNAYATMDSKHDLTEKLISGATSLFRGGDENIVEENTDDEAQAAITALNDQDFQGRKLRINEARPREERPNNGPRRPFNNNNNNNNTRRKF